jgi:hypothetical protein
MPPASLLIEEKVTCFEKALKEKHLNNNMKQTTPTPMNLTLSN